MRHPTAGLLGTTRLGPLLLVPPVAVLAVGLSLARRQPLSWDEAVTVAVATRPVHAIATTVQHSDAVLGLYYLLVHGWASTLAAVGVRPTEVWWRLPSAVAAVATCVVVAACARRLAGPAAGAWAGCLLAVLPLFSFYAVDARPYTLAALGVTTAWWVWTRPQAPLSLQRATITAAILVLGAWLQLFTVLVWPAFLLVKGRRSWRRSAATVAVAALGVVPVMAVALTQSNEIGWIPTATPVNTARVALHVAGGIGVAAALAVLVVAVVRSRRLRGGPTVAAVLWWSAAPFTLLALLDLVRPVLVARYALVSLPLAAVGVAVAVVRAGPGRPGTAIRVAGVATLVAAVVTSTVQDSRPWKYEDYRGATTFATTVVRAGTPVLFTPPSARLGFDLYAPRSYLRDVALPTGVGADPLAIAELSPAVVRAALRSSCTVVVFGDPSASPTPAASAPAGIDRVPGWAVELARSFGQVAVTVLHDPACGPRPSSRG